MQNFERLLVFDLTRWSQQRYRRVRRRAKQRGIRCEIDRHDIIAAVLKSKFRCRYCENPKMKFFCEIDNDPLRATIDRIRPADGYTAANITVCCMRCNARKHDSTPIELRALADQIERVSNEAEESDRDSD